ncbi:MAG: glycosyltransferase, partial [Solirubrobacteraceae bacterium]
MKAVELVVVNYHTPADLSRFCESLLSSPPGIPWHLTVVNVDSAEPDRLAYAQIEERFKLSEFANQIGCWDAVGNIGYARACNEAALKANPFPHEYLAFFNADVTLRPHAIDECIAALDANPEWGVLGPRQVDSSNRVTHAGIFGTPDHPRHRA